MKVFDRSTCPVPGNGSGLKVAVLDSGFSRTHPALRGVKITQARSFVGGDPYSDPLGHGTECSSILVAQANDERLSGIVPQVDLYIGQIISSAGRGPITAACQALEWVTSLTVDILAIPSGRLGNHPKICAQVEHLIGQGTTVFAPVGNPFSSQSRALYPAAYPQVIAVGSEVYQETYRHWKTPPALIMSDKGVAVCTSQGRWRIAQDTSHATLLAAGLAARELSWSRRFLRDCERVGPFQSS